MRESRSSGSVEGVMGNHDSYSDVEMKLALSQEEESQCTFHRGNVRQRDVAGLLERTKRRE
jgi:hypothetical protein